MMDGSTAVDLLWVCWCPSVMQGWAALTYWCTNVTYAFCIVSSSPWSMLEHASLLVDVPSHSGRCLGQVS